MEKVTFNPLELEFCQDCETDMCRNHAVELLKNSRYGELLAQNEPRFKDFWGGKKSRWDDIEKFKWLVGNDVDPLMHGAHQADTVALPMITMQNSAYQAQPFTRAEAKMLYLGNIFHDAHEGLTGDIAAPDKTAQTYEDELKINLEVVADILGFEPEDDFMRRYRGVVGDLNNWSFAGRAFNIGEKIGYFQTGLRVWAMRNHEDLSDSEKAAAEQMGREVCLACIPAIQRAAHEFIYCDWVLLSNAVALDEMGYSV